MCLAIPAKVIKIEGDIAEVELADVIIKANIQLVEGVEVGSWLLIHAGYAIGVMSEEEAMESLDLISQVLKYNESG